MTGWRCVLCERTRGVRLFAKGGWDFVRCAACGMVSLDPLPSAAHIAAHHAPIEDFAPGRRWALVTAFDVVEHLRDPVGFVRRAAGWLEPDGLLALTLPDAASPTARLMGRHWFY